MKKNNFQPDYTHLLKVMYNERPERYPLYEHLIDAEFVSKCIGEELSLDGRTSDADIDYFFSRYAGFCRDNTFDGVPYEASIVAVMPGHGAIMGGQGPIQTRDDFNKYPFDDMPRLYWERYKPRLDSLRRIMPEGMKAYGGCGFGIFEAAQDLVGYENLCMMQYIDPELFSDLFAKIGDMFEVLWTRMVKEYSDLFVFFRMGDDLGFRTSTMVEPDTIRNFILPQIKRVIDIVHAGNKKFLFHSCGNIFEVMPDILAMNIDAKHSNEDQIAPFEKWIELYGDKIGLFGGIDMNELILNPYDRVYEKVLHDATRFRAMAKGLAFGSGNSLPEYMSEEGFRAMVDAINEIRRKEGTL